MEAAQQFAGGEQFGVILAVEQESEGKAALHEADGTLADSYPHLIDADQSALSQHLLGFVTWTQMIQQFSLPAHCMPHTVNEVHSS